LTGKPTPNERLEWQEDILERHQLPRAYLAHAQEWFTPLVQALAAHQNGARRPVLIALNGCQGSGKSTLSDYLCAALQAECAVKAVALSLDDFYLTLEQRQGLAQTVHPLLATRGVPGTHDMRLLERTLNALLDPVAPESVDIPRFDKSVDDRRPPAHWDRVTGGVDLVLLEGWCLGARPQPVAALAEPVNNLEREEDPQGHWRAYVNEVLATEFEPLYQRIDQWIMLRAPSFDCVLRWRMEQEEKLAARTAADGSNRIMDAQQVSQFIQYYERLTVVCLEDLPARVHHLYTLDEQRRIRDYRYRQSIAV
jgi:D-glycerate 3-kinase